ncbi:hypothetical protein LTR62_000734 [Meristemomyces frigidus]|uniref:Uncharacterized protein n=1 Tax=Meristemomyces frigidus TaxID=1508187 RepID=A0AAN7TCR1_9PEZI|nr:hypothetical protein LTR62_000734 [Meristemomyces frigidus]
MSQQQGLIQPEAQGQTTLAQAETMWTTQKELDKAAKSARAAISMAALARSKGIDVQDDADLLRVQNYESLKPAAAAARSLVSVAPAANGTTASDTPISSSGGVGAFQDAISTILRDGDTEVHNSPRKALTTRSADTTDFPAKPKTKARKSEPELKKKGIATKVSRTKRSSANGPFPEPKVMSEGKKRVAEDPEVITGAKMRAGELSKALANNQQSTTATKIRRASPETSSRDAIKELSVPPKPEITVAHLQNAEKYMDMIDELMQRFVADEQDAEGRCDDDGKVGGDLFQSSLGFLDNAYTVLNEIATLNKDSARLSARKPANARKGARAWTPESLMKAIERSKVPKKFLKAMTGPAVM